MLAIAAAALDIIQSRIVVKDWQSERSLCEGDILPAALRPESPLRSRKPYGSDGPEAAAVRSRQRLALEASRVDRRGKKAGTSRM